MDAKLALDKLLKETGSQYLARAMTEIEAAIEQGQDKCVLRGVPSETVSNFVRRELKNKGYTVRPSYGHFDQIEIHWRE